MGRAGGSGHLEFFAFALSKLPPCDCQEGGLHACLWRPASSASVPFASLETVRVFHILILKQIFMGHREKRKRVAWGGREECERDREDLEPHALLLLASSQSFGCETRGQANRGQPAFNSCPWAQINTTTDSESSFSKDSFIH